MKKVKVWYIILNDGCGSAFIKWFPTKKQANKFADEKEGDELMMGDDTIDSVETYEGSDIHQEALKTDE